MNLIVILNYFNIKEVVMDIKQVEYIVTIEQEQSISRAAEKLFLTQSALNQQLLKLEKELGTPLFERHNHIMTPTFAGKIYLATAHRIIDMKQETYKIIRDVANENTGEISIAHTPEAGAAMFSKIYPIFRKKYPNIKFNIIEARAKEMERLILRKEVDFASIAFFNGSKNKELEYIGISSEKMVLGLPVTHPLAYLAGERSWDILPEIDLKLLQDDSFILLNKETRMRDMIDISFEHADYRPNILFESVSTRTVINMVENQIGPAFFPQSYVKPNDLIVYFTVAPFMEWTRGIAFLKGTYLSKPEKYYIELNRQEFVNIQNNIN